MECEEPNTEILDKNGLEAYILDNGLLHEGETPFATTLNPAVIGGLIKAERVT